MISFLYGCLAAVIGIVALCIVIILCGIVYGVIKEVIKDNF